VADKKPASNNLPDAEVEEFLKQWQSGQGQSAMAADAIQLAMQALRQPTTAADTQTALEAIAVERKSMHAPGACDICGHQNRPGNQFCGMCGLPLPETQEPAADAQAIVRQEPAGAVVSTPKAAQSPAPMPPGHHFYHHHYHHHYFPAGAEGASAMAVGGPRGTIADSSRDPNRAKTPGAPLTRAETAVRKLLQDWAFACNTRHLDDLIGIYASDAILLRANHPSVRGTAAIREFFVAALDSGFCDAELDPVRVEVFGDIAYEAGRFKALIPIAVSKRREERGKYLSICARQSNGEWKIIADCWSSDLALSGGSEPEPVRASSATLPVKSAFPRKNP
jgi:uncharacterized protein (TIGR02246 family)